MSGSRRPLRALLLAGLMLATGMAAAKADERVLDYDVDITIRPDARLDIIETITVRAEGKQIRRGIYRDFPTRYKARFDTTVRVGFDVHEVTRDGQPTPWHSVRQFNGVRVYIGDKDTQLAPGTYRYRLRYQTYRQLGYFDSYDELWWNVTGLGWAFPIDRATATVHLPADVEPGDLQLNAWTGSYGRTESDVEQTIVDTRTVQFRATAMQDPGGGLTVAVAWPKGLVHVPGFGEKMRWFVADNLGIGVLAAGLLATLAWYLWAWNRVGRDPEKGVIIPRFKPPAGLSPAACAYIMDMTLKDEAFTAAVISLGVKGHLSIEEADGEYTLRRRHGRPKAPPSPGEQVVFDALLPKGTDYVRMKQDNHKAFAAARWGLLLALSREYKGSLFRFNGHYALPAFAISAIAAVISVPLAAGPFAWVIAGALALPLHGLFLFLLRAPTIAGRRIMDEIEGFRMYLGTAERDRLQAMRSPALTPEVFERFLPYAFALEVENDWCRRFEREFPQPAERDSGFSPAWYSGDFSMNGSGSALNRMSSGFGSDLGGAISASSRPPGSSSGSGGGGFSGGGGGGGGGGGW
ncbi:DUF2207 domain-containing protein [Marinihelvus fidelis]|uniref:DUF2207 domain-containing protein n=1 Tax=Marinihelvus fidelis TaxID=2613842 RepID=A0A5N0TFK1_9GAMM|nr:DUF2207 domain-containing protein [Marinihelvus fidelis]KAA9132039.1 DUF2207 domain-containing protein [Marinihelvus fidelis]